MLVYYLVKLNRNVGFTNSFTLENLPAGVYYWSVQTIDNSFSGSEFATEQSFTIGELSNENDILTFSFPKQTGSATINSTSHTVNIEVTNGTNLANLVATFTLSDMATAFIGTIQQESGVTVNDFTGFVWYTIEAENGETQNWVVTVTELQLNTENDILTFNLAEQTGNATINSTNHTVDIEVANGTNLTNLVASFTLSDMATAFIGTTQQESGVTVNDFTNSVTYTIEAENGETQDWIVTVNVATSINQLSADKFSIFPNPTDGKIYIETSERIKKISVLDIRGKIILETTKNKIDLTNYETGTYILKIKTKNSIFTKTIIKE